MTTASKTYKKREYEQLLGKEIDGRYDLESLLGFGGMGAVYEALQRNMQRRVALKLIPRGEPKAAARFKREALTISKLQHPNTVTVFDYGETEDGMLFLAMEKLSGRTLGDVIEKEAPLDPKRAVHIASQVCRSLTEAHAAGIVHRDIKPENIFLIEVDEDADFVKVLDFGIAKSLQAEDEVTLTGEGRIIGTPRYMSPEQILAEPVDRRSDIYSLACIVFEMLCGSPPFDDTSTTKLMISHAKQPPPPLKERLTEGALSRIPGQLEDIVRRALSKSPSERQSQIDGFRQELERAVDNLESSALPPGAGMRTPSTDAKRQPESSDLLDMHSSQSLDRLSHTRSERQQAARVATSDAEQVEEDDDNTRLMLIVGIVLLMLVIGIGGYVAYTKDEAADSPAEVTEKTSMPVEPATPAATPPADEDDETTETLDFAEPEPATVRLEVTSATDGVTVYRGDEKWGTTPLERELAADAGLIELRFEKDGYRSRTRELEIDAAPGSSLSVDVSLTQKKAPRKKVRRTRSKPKPKPKTEPKAEAEPSDDEASSSEDSAAEKEDEPNVYRLDDEPSIPRMD